MKKRFIALIDLKDDSKALLSFAQSWAKQAEAELLIVHQSFSLDPALGESELRTDIRRQHRKDMLTELKLFVADTVDSSIPIKFHVTTGNLEASILRLNSSDKLDILFAGIKDKGLIARFFVTSTTIKLANEVNKIIVALPIRHSQPKLKKLYVGVNEKFPINEFELRNLLSVAGNNTERVHLVSLITSDRDTGTTITYLETLCKNLSDEVTIEYEVYKAANSLEGMKEYMQDKDGFLVIQKGSRSMLDLFRKFFVNDLVNYGHIPLIILPS